MVDYRINLAKTLASTPEQRQRFYHGMLIYLVSCAALMVLVAYLSSFNLKRFLDASKERSRIVTIATGVSGLDRSVFEKPEQVYAELETYSKQLDDLKKALAGRSHLLPIMHHLFADLPEGVELQSLITDDKRMLFDLEIPYTEDAEDPVRRLTQTWSSNEVLREYAVSITPLKGERRTVGGQSRFYYKFECVLK